MSLLTLRINTPSIGRRSARSVVKPRLRSARNVAPQFEATTTLKVCSLAAAITSRLPFATIAEARSPRTERRIASAVELVGVGANLPAEEVQQFQSDLTDLTKDSPKTQVASLRFKKVMAKVGTEIASSVREIVVDVLSEAAKKAIWGP